MTPGPGDGWLNGALVARIATPGSATRSLHLAGDILTLQSNRDTPV